MRIEDLKNWTVNQLKEEVVRLSDFFTCNGKVIGGGILHKNEDGTLCSVGKPLSIEFKCKFNDELFWTLLAPDRINQNNFRKMHGIPKRRKINGSRKNKY